ncbi:MAG: hypothetical protein NTW21_31540, partial [Verrucomicrobia bacterium]|nr:hypothetical protein [Verrucomicrobiota bacterium]
LRVVLPEPWLAALPIDQQHEWRARAAAVESDARVRLERLTAELELTGPQREKMFPVLVRAAPGYTPAMLVGGSADISAPSITTAEAVHQVLDPQQQALLEDREVNRQLWWQDTLARLEADLIESTGGVPAPSAAAPAATSPADATPAPGERVAPDARETHNLFDPLESNP